MYTIEYCSATKRNEIGSFVVFWMNLEPIILSEASQKEKNKYHILMHICGIQKYGSDGSSFRVEIETQKQRMDLWFQCERKGVGQIETVKSTYVHFHV